MSDEPPLTLHAHPLSSYCWKVLLALYETQTPFQQHAVAGSPKEDPVLTGYWPIGKMPVLYDATRATAVPESSIIIEYLQQYYPAKTVLIPADPEAALETRQWDRFFDLYVHNSMQKRVADRLRPEGKKDPAGVTEADSTLETAYTMLEQRMATRQFVAGDFGMADCAAMPALFYAEAIHPFSKTRPALAAYFDRLTSRPAARRVIREAQPYFQYFPFHDSLHPRFLEDPSTN